MNTLLLTDEEARMLLAIAREYLCKGGPAWECLPEWDMGFTSEAIEALGSKIERELD